MKSSTSIAAGLAAALAVGGFGYAMAQTPTGPGQTPGQGTGPGMMQPGQGMGPGMMQGQMPPGMYERAEEMHRRMHEGRHGDRYGHHEGRYEGHGSWGLGGVMRMCMSQDAFAPRMLERLERTTQPKAEQRAEFDALKAAATRAEQTLKAACPSEADRQDRSPTARFAMAEKATTAMAEAVKSVRPAFDAYYAKLDDKQRDRMRWAGGMWGGRDGDRERGERRGPPQGAPGTPGQQQPGQPGQR